MNKKIAVLPGDGIGPEVIRETRRVLDAVAKKFDHRLEYEEGDAGAIAIDRHGDPMPPSTLDLCKASDAVLFGAIGDPKYDNNPDAKIRPEEGLLKLRKELEVFASVRPIFDFVAIFNKSPLRDERIIGSDYVIYWEFNGGLYLSDIY